LFVICGAISGLEPKNCPLDDEVHFDVRKYLRQIGHQNPYKPLESCFFLNQSMFIIIQPAWPN
jgi:hypothetical protein